MGEKKNIVLQISPALHDGGVDKLLFDYCVRMPSEIEFCFAVSAKEEGMIEGRLRQRGCAVNHIEKISKHPIVRYRQIRKLIRQHQCCVVHDHTGYRAVISLLAAWKEGVPLRIAHAHIAGIPETGPERIIRFVCTWVVKRLATNLFACGEDAAEWMWGSGKRSGEVKIIRNAIAMNDYRFSECYRNQKREELGLAGKFVIGNVARLSRQKNQSRLLRIFSRVIEKNPDAILLLIGSGEDLLMLKHQAKHLGIDDKVHFLGARDDVPKLLNAFDVFVLPSLFEGLPIVLIEAQANGLPMVVSDTISKEGQVDDCCQAISLHEDDAVWAQAILDARRMPSDEVAMRLLDYDIDFASSNLAKWYRENLRVEN